MPVTASGGVGLRVSGATGERIAGYAGLSTCGSVWACPVCSAKIAAHRSAELEQVLNWAVGEGKTVALLTLTARHRRGDALDAIWDGVVRSWGQLTSGRAWVGENEDDFAARLATWEANCAAFKRGELARAPRGYRTGTPPVRSIGIVERWGLLGFARAIEATHGDNGWHPHLHVLMVLDEGQTPASIERLGEAIWVLWERALKNHGLTALRGPGLDIRSSEDEDAAGLGEYLTKQLAMETTHGYGKKAGKGRAPFQILGDLIDTYEARDYALWQEWQLASRGRRQLTWSRNLRNLAQLGEEQTDEEIALEAVDDGEEVLFMAGPTWRGVMATRSESSLLTLAERHGLLAVGRWLTHHGLGDWFIGRWTKDGAVPLPATPQPPPTP